MPLLPIDPKDDPVTYIVVNVDPCVGGPGYTASAQLMPSGETFYTDPGKTFATPGQAMAAAGASLDEQLAQEGFEMLAIRPDQWPEARGEE